MQALVILLPTQLVPIFVFTSVMVPMLCLTAVLEASAAQLMPVVHLKVLLCALDPIG